MLVAMSNRQRVKELVRWASGLALWGVSPLRKWRRRFVKLTPGVLSPQIILDVNRKATLAIAARDFVDLEVVRQIFMDEDYALPVSDHARRLQQCYDKIIEGGGTPLIIDCGGNIGLATRYFTETYPRARVICVEPDEKNLEAARANNRSDNIRFMLAGIGSADARANIVDPGLGNWGYRTEASPEGKTQLVSVNSLLQDPEHRGCIPFIIKIDIEGFEQDLFEKNIEWLDAFPLLIIELHDWMLPGQASSGNFLRAVAHRNRDFLYRNENVFSFSNSIA
ncbi:MAG: FkbM family methyltransferase [Variovorax sp.]|nr:FkbM family methyltransferase [Variovorax sp.]